MGLIKHFESEPMPYGAWCGVAPGEIGTATDNTTHNHEFIYYHPELVTPPRIYPEEPQSFSGNGYKLGCLWSVNEPTLNGPTTLCFLSVLRKYHWPSWDIRVWKMDGKTGSFLSSKLGASVFGDDSPGITYGAITWEPQGHLWEYAGHVAVDGLGAVQLDPATLGPVAGTNILPAAFPGHESDSIQEFAIDRRPGFDRMFIRWSSDRVGQVRVYKASTLEELTQVYACAQVQQLLVTNDGFLYVMDVAGWLHVYNFEGAYHGSVRHPQNETYPGGVAWGWDGQYKRLLRVAGTANESNGGSTLKIEGFYPVPEVTFLSPAIPRQVPRKGRTFYSLAHLCGEGGEPIAGRAVVVTGGASGTFFTGPEGDANIRITPTSTDSLELHLEARTDT